MFVAWKDLRFARGRFALVGTVIVLITLLVGLLSGLTAGLARQNTSAVAGLRADHLAFGAAAGGEALSFTGSQVTAAQWNRWAEIPGVAAAQPVGIATTKAAAGHRTTSVSAFGVEPGSDLATGTDRVSAGQVVVSERAAEDLEIGPGSTLTLAGQTRTVAAVAGDASLGHLPVIWTSLADWQQIAPPTGAGTPAATVIALRTRPGADLAAADARLGTRTVSRSGALSAIGSYTTENGSLQLMRGFLFAISALVIGAFFTVWTIQRAGDVAVLKALGASDRYLLKDALGQAVVLLVAGTLLGSALAAGFGALVVGGTVPFVLDVSTVLVPAAVMVILGLLGAALSVRRITAVDPLTALGSTR